MLRPLQLDFNAVPRGNPVAQLERFLELIARIEVEHVRPRLDLGQPMDDHAPFRPKGRGHGQLGKIMLHGPGDDLPRRGRFQPPAMLGQLSEIDLVADRRVRRRRLGGRIGSFLARRRIPAVAWFEGMVRNNMASSVCQK